MHSFPDFPIVIQQQPQTAQDHLCLSNRYGIELYSTYSKWHLLTFHNTHMCGIFCEHTGL